MNQKTKKLLQIFMGLSALGWINSLYTLYHRQSLFIRGSEDSFCRVNAKIDCDVVALSKFSSFLGLPTSAWGLVYYSALFALALWAYFAWQDKKEDEYASATTVAKTLSVFGLLPTVILAGLSLFVIKSVCLMCVLTYLINIALALVAVPMSKGAAKRPSALGAFQKIPQSLWITALFLTVAQLFAPTIIDTSLTEGPQIDDKMTNLILTQYNSSNVNTFKLENTPTRGNPTGSIVFVEFSDFQCPHCARSAKIVPPILQAKSDNIQYHFKNYPLDNSCNPNITGSGHPFACEAAKAGICVFKNKGSDVFFQYKEETFANQATMSSKSIAETALKYGISADQLASCLNDQGIHQELLDQIAEAKAAKVEGTPAIFINGRFVETGSQPKILIAILDELIK